MNSDLLYFAYGSNLNEADLRQWCQQTGRPYPLGEKYANAWLPDMQLVFNYNSQRRKGGALNLRHRLGQATPGTLFHIAVDGLATLDEKEGSPNVYKHLDVTALTEDGREHSAITYQVHTAMIEGVFVPPHSGYLKVLQEGFAAHGLDDCMLNAASEDKDPPGCIDKLFVYGTLKEGGPRHHILQSWGDYERKIEGRVRGTLYDTGKGFPCMVPAQKDDHFVAGEIYPLKDIKKVFEMLDIVEAVKRFGESGAFFRRAIIRTETADGSSDLAWSYLSDMDIQGMTRIESGKWPAVA